MKILFVLLLILGIAENGDCLAQSTANNKYCEVHGDILEKDVVPVKYGLKVIFPDEIEDREKLFPNSNKEISGGCIITEESENYSEVLYCKSCRKVEEQYEQEGGRWVKFVSRDGSFTIQFPGELTKITSHTSNDKGETEFHEFKVERAI